MEEECQKLVDERHALRGILSPLCRCPPEVLAEIFSLVVHSNGRPDSRIVKISLVCKTWREVATGTPDLWNHLDIMVDAGRIDVGKIARWLGRSGGLRKRLGLHHLRDTCSMRGRHHPPGDCSLHTNGIHDLLTQGPKVQYLALCRIPLPCLHSLSEWMKSRQRTRGPQLALKTLSITLQAASHDMPFNTLSEVIPNWPSLKSLRLGNHQPAQLSRSTNGTVFANPTNLVIDRHATISSVMAALHACTNLHALDLHPIVPESPLEGQNTPEFTSPYILPRLHTLRLRCTMFDDAPTFLQALRAPSLVHLRLSFEEDDLLALYGLEAHGYQQSRVEFGDGILDFIEESKAHLRHLQFRNLAISSHGLQRILDRLPMLVHLTLNSLSLDVGLFQPTHETDGLDQFHHPPLLPHLEVLELRNLCLNEERLSYEDICDYFAKRNANPAESGTRSPLRTIRMESGDMIFCDASESLRAAVSRLRRLGVDVYTA